MSHIASIVFKPTDLENQPADQFSRVAMETAGLVAGHGIAGDTKGDSKNRQLNIMRSETITELHREGYRTSPGELGEQIVIAGLPPDEWIAGATLRLGESAVVELISLRKGCARFAHIQDRPIQQSEGRIGFMARVVQSGEIAVGSPVEADAISANRSG
ncbi:MAG: MOSC domain-containing protein [Pirellulales bacterium]